MADVTAIREALAAALAVIPDVQVNAYALSSATPPCIEVEPGSTTYDIAMGRGADRLKFTVRAFVALNLDIGAQMRLDLMLAGSGANSVKAAVETDRTLGGLVDSLRVTENMGYRRFVKEQAHVLLGSEWTVEVIASGH
jgi:hypothetical protein